MKRIVWFILISAVPGWTAIVEAQQQAKTFKIGWLESGTTDRGSRLGDIFLRRLSELGFVEGKNIAFEYRSADNKLDRLPALADELVRLNIDVLLTTATPATIAAKNATKTIPIVFMQLAVDPVAVGFVNSLACPGGNITGVTNIAAELAGKRLEILKETVPKLLQSCAHVGAQECRLCANLERKPTAGKGIGPAALFHGSQQRGPVRERVQRSD
jgi:putative ABC transport system substrate-binding protein